MLEPQITAILPERVEERPGIEKQVVPAEAKVYRFNAYHLAEALKLKEIAKLFDLKPLVLNPTRLVYELAENCYCILYNFGAVVFFNVDSEVQNSTLERLKNSLFLSNPVTTDEFLLEEKRRAKNEVFFDNVVVDKLNRDKIELLSLVLAQSTALEFFENKVDELLNQVGVVSSKPSKIRSFISQAMLTKQNLIGTLYLLEKPEETWENKILDDLHQEATMMFELKERLRALDYKLKTIQENLELLSNFTTNRQMLILEAAIVGLFILDLILVGHEVFWK